MRSWRSSRPSRRGSNRCEALIHQRPQAHDGRPVGGDGDRTQQIDHLQQLRAEIDAQLRDLQRP